MAVEITAAAVEELWKRFFPNHAACHVKSWAYDAKLDKVRLACSCSPDRLTGVINGSAFAAPDAAIDQHRDMFAGDMAAAVSPEPAETERGWTADHPIADIELASACLKYCAERLSCPGGRLVTDDGRALLRAGDRDELVFAIRDTQIAAVMDGQPRRATLFWTVQPLPTARQILDAWCAAVDKWVWGE